MNIPSRGVSARRLGDRPGGRDRGSGTFCRMKKGIGLFSGLGVKNKKATFAVHRYFSQAQKRKNRAGAMVFQSALYH
jgi:hypothetical protein